MSKQGEGKYTKRKEEGFAVVYRQALKLSRAPGILPYAYWGIDLTCGSGFNPKPNCEGSPLVFLREALVAGRRINVVFSDKNANRIEQLRDRLAGFHKDVPLPTVDSIVKTYCADAIEMLSRLTDWIRRAERNPQYAVGTLLYDPNGGYQPEFVKALADFAAIFPRIDLVLNVNTSFFARIRGCRRNPTTPQNRALAKWIDPTEFASVLPRPHWLVRNLPPRKSGERFTILLGRTHSHGMDGFADFFPVESEIGQQILGPHFAHIVIDQLSFTFPE